MVLVTFILFLQISPEDIQWVDGTDPVISHKGGYGGPGHGVGRPAGRDSGPGGGRGRGMTKGQIRKDFPPSQNGIGKKGLDDIQLLQTDTLIKEVNQYITSMNWRYCLPSFYISNSSFID